MEATRENWKLKLEQQRKLKRRGALMIRHRVELLIQIENDDEFFAWCDANATSTIEQLDCELDDVGFNFMTLKNVFETITDPKRWERTSLRMLVAEVFSKPKKERVRNGKTPTERIAELEKENERLSAALLVSDARVSELENVVRLLAGERSVAEVG